MDLELTVLKLVSRNVAVSKSHHRLLFSPNGKDKSTEKFLIETALGSGGRFIEREGVSTLSIHGYPWALRYLLICVFKMFVCFSRCEGLEKVSFKDFRPTLVSVLKSV